MKDKKAFILTFVQYSTLVIMLWQMTWLSSIIVLKLFELLGGIIALWAFFEMRKSKLNISPTPKQGALLVDTGIYSVIRHPMYSSLLLVFVPMLISDYSLSNLAVFGVFAVNLILKLEYEEILLKQFFPDYSDYSMKTSKIIPYIY